MNPNQALDSNHPSFGTNSAVFMFGLEDRRTGQIKKFLLIEAQNPAAVAVLERVMLTDQKVADNCRILAIFRDCRNLGTRDDWMEEIPYVDFMLDIVDQDRLLGDAVTAQLFSQSLGQNMEYAQRKVAALLEADRSTEHFENIKEIFPATDDSEVVEIEEVQEKPVPVVSSVQRDQLKIALCKMGFRKPEVEKFVTKLGKRVATENLTNLIVEGLRELAA